MDSRELNPASSRPGGVVGPINELPSNFRDLLQEEVCQCGVMHLLLARGAAQADGAGSALPLKREMRVAGDHGTEHADIDEACGNAE